MNDYIEITDPDEILKEGDEYYGNNGEWCKVDYYVGAKRSVMYNRVRRPITPTPEPEYRMLVEGEMIEAGDEFELDSGVWKPTGCQGEVYLPNPEDDKVYHHGPHRRPVAPTPEPQYRRLEAGEPIAVGDEYQTSEGEWQPTNRIGTKMCASDLGYYRRPVTPTPPVVTYGGNLNPTDPKGSIGATKCPLHLLPVSLMEETSWVLKGGAEKYGVRNYRHNTVCASTYISAIMRHLNKWREREDLDTESGRSHLAHIAANCAILMDAAQHGTLEDDRA